MFQGRSRKIHPSSIFAALLLAGLPASAGTFSYTEFNADINSGIGTDYSYTAKADFAGPGNRVINGVTFNNTGLTGTNYALTIGALGQTGRSSSVGGNAGGAVSDFYYTLTGGAATLSLSGLVVGQTYVTSWYNQSYGDVNGRLVDITPSDTNVPFRYSEDFSVNARGNILRYTFTANSTSINYTFDAVNDNDSFHHYAFTNALSRPNVVIPRIFQASGAGPAFRPFSPLANDLLQTQVASVTSSPDANFMQESAGGLPALTDGDFYLKGGDSEDSGDPTVNDSQATVENNKFIQYALNVGTNTLGYDVSKIELFGGWNDDGRDHQNLKVLYSVVGSPNYVEVGTADFDPQPVNTGQPSAVRIAFDTALTGVDGIRIEFADGQENDYVGLGEVDVVGVATVPEPATATLGLLGALGLAVRRRRR